MLGLVLSGNIAMVFVFWELVGICSYFLIGFYVERKSASTAANKAFIVNRVGDFGMLIGLMALWSSLGTFAFGDIDRNNDQHITADEQGIFSQVRPGPDGKLIVPDAMVLEDKRAKPLLLEVARDHGDVPSSIRSEVSSREEMGKLRSEGAGYWLLVVAGVGIFCGCVGKSAQFPLHTWLPDAMEGPTPVSALVHSATMVAAGVYLVGRFFPVFAPEALFVIACVGCITLFLAATIAITAVDIKRVLAYSTISQLGYMMLSLGVGGWRAGLMHLITHAFFKSLLFMCSGSVIHAVHTNDMRQMGGLLKKMPVTAITMLIGCLAIAGVGVPFVVGFSGYYSKDAILEQALSFSQVNHSAWASVFFYAAAGGAAITAFYMFRMWYMTFVGKPRDKHAYEHAHESPPVMFMPLVILAVFATAVAWDINLLGFGIIPVVVLISLGLNHGWFAALAGGGGHGHDAHGHGHDDHGHDSHGHDDHAHSHAHDDHGHDDHSHAHGHASPATTPQITWSMLAVAFVLTMVVGGLLYRILPESNLSLANLLEDARPFGTLNPATGRYLAWTWPNEHDAHAPSIVRFATLLATGTWVLGIGLATVIYAFGWLRAEDVRRSFEPIYQFLWNKWYFDELYNFIFVQPALVLGRFIAGIDKNWIDVFIDGIAKVYVSFTRGFEMIADRGIVDGLANLIAGWTYSLGLSLRTLQTGRLRQYVMFIVIGAIALFVLISFFWNPSLAAR
jgi:NADH-quinone oxidoreductase subunit L